MDLATGTKLLHYRLAEPIGEGAMGVVWRAEDTSLRRDAAVKVLPQAFAENEERLIRFEREARLLASLNHPNIATAYGLHEADGVRFIAMEFVDGEELAERLQRGRMPLDEVIEVALGIADALEAAHGRSVIHRDLKPANIKITPDGTVKVLDFGLAKMRQPENDDIDQSLIPTATGPPTAAGAIMGTAPYMAPEQAHGRPADQRADIWAFGCVLYEMLSGNRAFSGSSATDTLAAILRATPDWNLLPVSTPNAMQQLIVRCLTKDPRRRLQSIGDARIALEEIREGDDRDVKTIEPTSMPREWFAWLVAAAAVVLLAFTLVYTVGNRRPRMAPPPTSVSVTLPEGSALDSYFSATPFAISADGTQLAWIGRGERGTRLFTRNLERYEIEEVAGTESSRGPFFSPDGKWIGFFSGNGIIKKVSIGGGVPLEVCDAGVGTHGATWGPDNTIVFSGDASAGLLRVPAAGGPPEVLTTVDHERGETGHAHPQFLPGGDAVIFTIFRGDAVEDSEIAALSLTDGSIRIVHSGGIQARYAADGYLVYGVSKGLMALPFDPQRLEATGSPISVLTGVHTPPWFGTSFFAVSETGSLVYVEKFGRAPGRTLLLVEPDGTVRALAPGVERPFYWPPRLSPDGQRLLVDIAENDRQDIWVFDLARIAWTRLTFEAVNNALPMWTPDGRSVVYTSNVSGPFNMYRMAADGGKAPEPIRESHNHQVATSWDPTGRLLAFYEIHPQTYRDLWVLDTEAHEATPFLVTPADERAGMFSPDGRWMAYVSDESGRDEVYVRAFPGPGGRWQVSVDGGTGPKWSRDGRRLHYRERGAMMAVDIEAAEGFSAARPNRLFDDGPYLTDPNGNANYDLTADGDFIMISGERLTPPTELRLVIGWSDSLTDLME